MRQIKFRGRTYSGKIIFGKGVYSDEFGTHIYFRTRDGLKNAFVYPESVAQLVEVIDGKEIYEGDTVELDGKKFIAELGAIYDEAN